MADESTERILILLQAKDRDFARAMDRNNKLIAKFEKQANASTSGAAKKINANLSTATATAANFGKGMLAGIGAGLIGAALAAVSSDVRATIGDIADLADTAERVGVDVESFQGLQDGFKLAGVEAASFNSGLEKFVENIGDAARGTGNLGKILRANGIAITNQDGSIRDTTAVLRDYADLIASVPDEAERMSLITEAFGRGGKAMVLALGQGSASLTQMIADAKEAGRVLDADVVAKAAILDDKFDMLTATIGVFFKTLVVESADAVAALFTVEDAVDRLKNKLPTDVGNALPAEANLTPAQAAAVEDLTYAYDALQQSARAASDAIGGEVNYLIEIGQTGAAERLYALSSTIDQLSADFAANKITAEEYQAGLAAVADAAVVAVSEIDAIDGIDLSNASAVISAFAGQMAALAATAATAATNVAAAVLSGQGGMATGSTDMETDARGRRYAPSRLAPTTSVRPQTAPPLLGEPALPTGGGGSSSGGGSGSNDQLREAERLYESTRTEAEKYAAELASIKALQAAGYIDADTYARAVEQVGEKFGETAEAAKAFEDSARSAFVGIVTGAESAQDAVANLLDRLAEMLANEAFTALMHGSLGGGSGGGLLAGIGKLFGGARANGGAVSAGKVHLVGERGPELYVPSSNGMIVPNHALQQPAGSAQSSGPPVFHINVVGATGNREIRQMVEQGINAAKGGIVRQSMAAVRQANAATGVYLP